MALLEDISLRRAIALLVLSLGILLAGTWLIAKTMTDHLMNEDAEDAARSWSGFLAANVPDLAQVAAGEQASSASLAFFDATRKAGEVFRYVIFNGEGYPQLLLTRAQMASVEHSEFNADAGLAAATGRTIVGIKHGSAEGEPKYFAEAFVPVFVKGNVVAIVAASVDESRQYSRYYHDFLVAALAFGCLTGLSFGLPAVALYRRTREKQQADRRIQYLANHDVLTGLANRARLIERLEAALAVLPSTGGMVALHFIDIDHFKQINDTIGHDGGDFLLSTIGERLKSFTRLEDLVARLGGDEFVIVQTGVADKAQAEAFAARTDAMLRKPIYFKEQQISSSYTIGVALAPADGATPVRLLKSADLALYAGKAAGRDCIRFFLPEMDEALQKRIALEKIIRDAVARNGFALHYQPVFEISGKKLIGFEALARLPAPDGTLIPPGTFIPAAEEMRLIDKIGIWVLHEACCTAASWPEHLTVAVNLSPVQFESGDIENIVADALKTSGLAAHRLELEITETLLLRNNDATMATLKRLKAIGVSIVLDDFGTGYSSLSYLWKFPFDKIKIDRSFMESFETSGRDVETVVKTVIALGREMKMRVTVEGVETPAQIDFLYDADADQVQGFYFGKPVPAAEVSANILKAFRQNTIGEATDDKKRGVIGQMRPAPKLTSAI